MSTNDEGWERCAVCKKFAESWLIFHRFQHRIRVCRTCSDKWCYRDMTVKP